MARCYERGILSHTVAARPFWVGDVDVTRRCPAPRLHSAPVSRSRSPNGLRRALKRVLMAVAGR